MIRLTVFFSLAALALACSPATSSSSKCTPGNTKDCTCTDGTKSQKTCGDDKKYGACACPGGETTGGETTGGETTGGETTGGETTGSQTTGGETTGGETTGGETTGGETTGGETTGGETTGGETTGGETTGGETTGGETTGGETTGDGGQCLNDADLEIMGNTEAVFEVATNCAVQCVGDAVCAEPCIKEGTGLSAGCAGCWGLGLSCGVSMCLELCAADAGNDACKGCMEENCSLAFETCAGIPLDLGGGGSTTGGGNNCDGGCPDGFDCIEDTCVAIDDGCGSNDECGAGMVCQDGACVAAPPEDCGAVSFEGCCAADELKYCDGAELKTLACTAGTCGWQPDGPYYDCNTEGTEDPSGANPMACP